VRPVISDGEYGYQVVNVTTQRHDPTSLLSWFERMMRTLREAPEVGSGTCTHVDVPAPEGLLVHRADDVTGTMLFLHNLGPDGGTVDLGHLYAEAQQPNDVLADQEYADVGKLDALTVAGHGYRWIRLRRGPRD
jgi:maltose alpha-D-glucosyltransferase/alpha-amylase